MTDAPSPRCSSGTEDPAASEDWGDGCDFALEQLCIFLGVDATQVTWDAATETVDGDVRSVIGNIFRAKFGEDWSLGVAQAEQQRGEPVAWIAFASNGNIRFWTADAARAAREKVAGMDLRMFTLAELVALAAKASPPAALPAGTVTVPLEALRNCGCPADFRGTIGQCEDSGQCGCSINLKGRAVSMTPRTTPIDHSEEECPNFPGCHCVDQCCDGWRHPSPEISSTHQEEGGK